MANFEARKVLMKDAQGRYVIPFTGAVETVNGFKPDENGNVVIEGVDTTTLLTKAVAAETYLSKSDASATYLNVDTAADTFLNKTDAASTYLTQAQAYATYLGIGDKAVSAETADNAVSATMASKAISDANGNAIATTYATKAELTEKVNGCLPLSGGKMTGFIGFDGDVGASWPMPNGITYSVRPYSPTGVFQLIKEKPGVAVSAITFFEDGAFSITANNFSTEFNLYGNASGSLIWGDKNIIRSVNGMFADASGNININLIPVGSVMAFAANSAPSGYLLCNGADVSRTTYAALFAKIGTIYGAGDGSTTFNLPDLVGRVIQGTGEYPLYIEAGLPNITGYAGDLLWNTQIAGSDNKSLYRTGLGDGKWAYIGGGGFWTGTARLHIDASKSSSIYGKSDTVQPRALAMRYYIKY